MKNYPKKIKNTLHSVIRDMAKHPEDFCRSPGKDFTRDRKLLTLLVKMGGYSLRDEMLDCLGCKEMPASVSALVQQRSKLVSGFHDPPTCYAQITEKVHPPPDALILFASHLLANVINLMTLPGWGAFCCVKVF